ncbi:MAG: transglutaminase domain-containing protein [Tannerellaceae bacterium]|jgi:transglutaminase-like putative cysteine protease|nr:transglutaminase domain-containing protein [Tannerellaceae bacterium]
METGSIRVWGIAALLCGGLCGCENHFISDAAERATVENDLMAKREAMPHGDLFRIFEQELTTEEREALAFLYAYMPIGDITDYDGAFYLANVQSALRVRKEMPWGRTIPEKIFRHFVLPVRVNNEALDSSRIVFYKELRDRVKKLTAREAVLEVNHWCHEKVIYAPSDARTSSALASVRTAFGRCGEESTFAVAALRAVGIPARQVYTPRWAHTDDNHAWVEAWVDGEWVFMGACEPEPVLNLGWFNAPASRGMLMHTKVFGRYEGTEEVMERTAAYTEVNVTSNYAATAKATVTVRDAEGGHPVPGAKVEFRLYNYAEFFPVATKICDSVGRCELTAGKGDMLLWATHGDKYGFARLSFGSEQEKVVVLDRQAGNVETIDLDLTPPTEGAAAVTVTAEQREENSRRLREEDAIRNAYTAGFFTREQADTLAAELGTDKELTAKYMLAARGNYGEIERFLRETAPEKRLRAMALLGVISAKDLRDTPAETLRDHTEHVGFGTERGLAPEIETRYVLNPRVGNELLTPYKGLLREAFAGLAETGFQPEAFAENPLLLAQWTAKHITVKNELSPQRIPMSPYGTLRARVADELSRNTFFVAAARTLGTPARFDPLTRKVQAFDVKSGEWVYIDFDEDGRQPAAGQGALRVTFSMGSVVDDPKYGTHFTIARVHPNGRLQTLHMRHGTWSGLLKAPFPLEEGAYLMVAGTRLSDGKVLARMTFFNITADKTTTIPLSLRESAEGVAVIGEFNSENSYLPIGSTEAASILSVTGRGYFVVGLLGVGQEPTNHALRDLAAVKTQLEAWGRPLLLLFTDGNAAGHFDANEFGDLPSAVHYGIDTDGAIRKEIVESMKLTSPTALPVFIIADTFNRVLFVSQGYTIGLGEQLLATIRKL